MNTMFARLLTPAAKVAYFSAGLLLLAAALPLASGGGTARASIHEKIAAACREGGEEVVAPGQVLPGSNSFLRALQASGVIESIEEGVGDGNDVRINFDLSEPSSKFISAGSDLTVPDALGPGVDLTLSPLPVLNPEFAAHAHCANLNP